MSITDSLTNIHNRRYFDDTLKTEMARAIRKQEPISVLIVDIDFFKEVNDTYGHQVGDEVLKKIAVALTQVVSRSTDFLARFGGDRKSTRLNSSHVRISYAVFCLKKKKSYKLSKS